AKVGGAAGVQAGVAVDPAGDHADVEVLRGKFTVSAEQAAVGGLYGENRGTTQRGIAQDTTISATGEAVKLGGIAGRNIGALRDSEARNVRIDVAGENSEAGGIVGRTETTGDRATVTDVTL